MSMTHCVITKCNACGESKCKEYCFTARAKTCNMCKLRISLVKENREKVAIKKLRLYHKNIKFNVLNNKEFAIYNDIGINVYYFRVWLEWTAMDRYGEIIDWDNMEEWHLDHIMPIKAKCMNLKNKHHIKYLRSFKNYQLLKKHDNISKNNRLQFIEYISDELKQLIN